MIYQILANIVAIIHFAFIIFVVFGALLLIKRRWVALFHIPSVVWGMLIEFKNWECPLTPLEVYLLEAGGLEGYSGGFIEHYLISIIYPEAMSREVQIMLGVFVFLLNAALYAWLLLRASFRN
jgi:hypothetical protein